MRGVASEWWGGIWGGGREPERRHTSTMNDAKRKQVAKCLRYIAARVREGVNSAAVLDTNGSGCGDFQTYKDTFSVEIRTVNSAFKE